MPGGCARRRRREAGSRSLDSHACRHRGGSAAISRPGPGPGPGIPRAGGSAGSAPLMRGYGPARPVLAGRRQPAATGGGQPAHPLASDAPGLRGRCACEPDVLAGHLDHSLEICESTARSSTDTLFMYRRLQVSVKCRAREVRFKGRWPWPPGSQDDRPSRRYRDGSSRPPSRHPGQREGRGCRGPGRGGRRRSRPRGSGQIRGPMPAQPGQHPGRAPADAGEVRRQAGSARPGRLAACGWHRAVAGRRRGHVLRCHRPGPGMAEASPGPAPAGIRNEGVPAGLARRCDGEGSGSRRRGRSTASRR